MRFVSPLRANSVFALLLKIIGCLILLGTLSNYLKNIRRFDWALGFIPLFDLNGEYNPPALYSSFAIWFCAFLLWSIHLQERRMVGTKAGQWKVLSIIFLYLGLDELAGMHECFARIAPYVSHYVHLPNYYLYWTVSFGILLTGFAVYFYRFYLRLPTTSRLQFTVAGLIYVGGAIGMELIGGWYEKHVLGGLYDSKWFPHAFGMGVLITIEEGMEMVGIALFIRALFTHLEKLDCYPTLRLVVDFQSKTTVVDIDRRKPQTHQSHNLQHLER